MAFKMKGHSLPGPHQRKSPAKQATLSTVSDSLQNLPNPAAEKLRKEYEAAQKKLREDAQKNMDANTDSTNTANQAELEKRAEQIQQTVSPNEFNEQIEDLNEKNSPANQNSPAKQLAAGGTKRGKGNIFTKRGRKQRQLNKHAKELAFENYAFNQETERKRKAKKDAKKKKIYDLLKEPIGGKKSHPGRKEGQQRIKSPAKCPLIAMAAPMIMKAAGGAISGAMKKKEE